MERLRSTVGRIILAGIGAVIALASSKYLLFLFNLFMSDKVVDVARSLIMIWFTLGLSILFFFIGLAIIITALLDD